MMRFIKLLPLVATFGVILLIASCEDDKTTNPQDQPPALPHQSTMIMDFNDLPDSISDDKSTNQILTQKNWGWAASNVDDWNSVLSLPLVLPVSAFLESFNHQPTKQPDGSWMWRYIITQQETIYSAKLYGTKTPEDIEWRMLITKEGEYTDFEWFTGHSNLAGTEGDWILNKEPKSPVPFLSIEWHRNIQQETKDIKYTKLTPILPGNESYIFYGTTNEVLYNRFCQIYSAGENRLVDIKWNYEMKFGRVKDPTHFEDGNWNCWDEKLDDVNCSE